MALTDSQLASYHDDGFLLVRRMFSRDRMRELAAEIDGLHERMAQHEPDDVSVSWEEDQDADRPPRIRQLMHSQRVSPILDAISRSDEVLSIMQQLIGPDVLLFHSKLMMKSAHDGTFTPWHQDWGYWQHSLTEPTQVNCMLSIDPATEANGAVRFVRGSHRDGAAEHITVESKSFNICLPGDLDAYDAEVIETEPGDALLFGCMVVHGSAPNSSAQDRRANTYAFDKTGNTKNVELPADHHRLGRRDPGERAVS